MKIINFKHQGTWRDVADSARTTVGLENGEGEPSDKWKKKILLAEHSPIRELVFKWEWIDIPSWVSVHFVRHKIGIEHYVKTQRSDRTGINRDELPQGALVNHRCTANAQAIINMSIARRCTCAHQQVRMIWDLLITKVRTVNPCLADICVAKCLYRGFCPGEFSTCGFDKTEIFQTALKKYRRI